MPGIEEELGKHNGNPTDINATAQAPITKGDDGLILDDYAMQNESGKVIDNTKYSNKPNTSINPDKSNTGSGLSSATITNSDGTKESLDYSWDTKASERANLDYKSAVLESKSNYLTNRQELESQGQQLQQQVDMQQYSQNQSNEKAGWTGGYVLDTERQMAYLKQTIQSQMYGQMELQKYGYDTSLAAARLAYDTNKYDLALEYYNTALSRAVSEAEITGYYISPEVSEMLNQYSIASQALNNGENTERNEQIIKSVYDWFEANGISKQGVETMVHQEFILSLKEAAINVANFKENSVVYQQDLDSFGKIDENGNLTYTDGYNSVEFIHFNELSNEEILKYASQGSTQNAQLQGYLTGLIEQDLIKITENRKDGKPLYKEDLENYLEESSSNRIKELLNTENGAELLKNFSYSSKVNDKNITININDQGQISYTHEFESKQTEEDYKTKAEEAKNRETAKDSLTFTDIITQNSNLEIYRNMKVQEDKINGDKIDDDFDINIGSKNYDLDVQWKYGSGWDRFWSFNDFTDTAYDEDKKIANKKPEEAWAYCMDYLNTTYGTPDHDELVLFADKLWFYSKKIKKWGYVQTNTGGNKLKEDIKTAINGSVPGRW